MIRKIPIALLIFIIFSSCLNSNETQTNIIEGLDESTEGIPDYLSDAWLCLEAKAVDDMDTEEEFQIILANTLQHDKNVYSDHH